VDFKKRRTTLYPNGKKNSDVIPAQAGIHLQPCVRFVETKKRLDQKGNPSLDEPLRGVVNG
jgi:hypothetical protein